MEILITNENKRTIKVIREKTDPLCMRASIGGTMKEGFYLVFRGDNLEEVETMLTETLEALNFTKSLIEDGVPLNLNQDGESTVPGQ